MSGIVMDSESRKPIEGARVAVVGNKAQSDAITDTDGSFILTFRQGVVAGTSVRLQVERSGFKPYSRLVAVSPTIPLQIALISDRTGSTVNKKSIRPVAPIDDLAKLGWTVQPVEGNTLQFSDNGNHISLEKSVPYFCALDRPFIVSIVSATSLAGAGGLGNARFLTKLYLNSMGVDDLSELRYLHNITGLTMSQTVGHISDLTPLQDLKNLTELGLDSAAIRDLGPIQGLTNLRTLSIGGTHVSDLRPIGGLHKLESLNLGGAPVTDLSPLAAIDTLTKMTVTAVEVPFLPTLKRTDILKSLSVYQSTGVVDLSPIAQFSALESLTLNAFGAQALDISFVRQLKNLTELLVTGNGFEYVTALAGLNAVGDLTHLKTLRLFGIRMSDLGFAGNLKSLTEISVVNAPLNNIVGLGGLQSLRTISLIGTAVIDISPLLDVPNLETLNISRTPARADVLTELERRGVKIQR
jgi:Leucine-rich repeat (LRR) protein